MNKEQKVEQTKSSSAIRGRYFLELLMNRLAFSINGVSFYEITVFCQDSYNVNIGCPIDKKLCRIENFVVFNEVLCPPSRVLNCLTMKKSGLSSPQ